MKVIGVTGGIGAGKSLLMELAAQKPFVEAVKADEVGHKAMEPGTRTYMEIIALFGEGIIKEDRSIHRAKLAEIVFADGEKLKALNAIVHPFVRNYVEAAIEEARAAKGCQYFLIESAILLEAGYGEICDEIWAVAAEGTVRGQRLKSSRGYSDEKIEAIMNEQMPEGELLRQADVIIENNGQAEELKSKLDLLLA